MLIDYIYASLAQFGICIDALFPAFARGDVIAIYYKGETGIFWGENIRQKKELVERYHAIININNKQEDPMKYAVESTIIKP